MMALFSLPEAIKSDSETKRSNLPAILIASSRLCAYCRISRASIETGVFASVGYVDFAAFIVIQRMENY